MVTASQVSRSGSLSTPACGTGEWVILEIMHVPVRWPAELHAGGPTFSMVPRGCRNCGHVMFFSAAKIGVKTDDRHTHDHPRG
jgi:hypothetical protein